MVKPAPGKKVEDFIIKVEALKKYVPAYVPSEAGENKTPFDILFLSYYHDWFMRILYNLISDTTD